VVGWQCVCINGRGSAVAWHLNSPEPYTNRREAGVVLALRLTHYEGRDDTVVLALPRGGVPVAFEVARALKAPLDVFLVRKLGVPGHSELAMGAIATGGVRVLNSDVIEWYRVPSSAIEQVARDEEAELQRRERAYRSGRAPLALAGHVVVLVDDGLATGSTMKAAVQAIRAHRPSRIVVAVPVGAPDTCREFAHLADEVICARIPDPFSAVGLWYRDFTPTTDAHVRELLQAALHEVPS
jgi:predicted phosphoribosyltransferase